MVFTSCAASKDDSVQIPDTSKVIEPRYYLDERLVPGLLSTRESIFRDPHTCVGSKTCYALDLYGRAGRAYKKLFEFNYSRLKSMLLSGGLVEWFFLSGGYGVVHALEKARKYQATFTYGIARENDIPYTAKLWEPVLTPICDSILSRFRPDFVYVFGNRDYTEFIKQTNYWKTHDNIRMFESTGSAGPYWLSPILNELVEYIFRDNVEGFNASYDKFTKQRS